MNRNLLLHPIAHRMILAAVLCFLAFSFGVVCGQDDAEEDLTDPKRLLEIADKEIFIRDSFKQDFSEIQGYVNEFPNPLTVHQYYIMDGEGSDMLMTMQPSEETVHTTNKRLKFEQVRKNEFHVTYSVARKEDIPTGGGGICWIQYSNYISKGVGKESGVILYPGKQVYYFTPDSEGSMTYESIADLSDLDPDEYNSFDFIRLDGIMYFYVNGKFRFSYDDGIKDIVTFEGGAELYERGNRVRCTFDDFTMRIK